MILKTSVVTFVAAGFIATAASASACNWHEKQNLAHATTPAKEKDETVTTATPVDPALLARMEARQGEARVPTEPAAKQ